MGRKTIEINYQVLKSLYKQNMQIKDIALYFKVSKSRIRKELERTGLKPGPTTVDTSNKECSKCIYRGTLSFTNNEKKLIHCNYCLIEGHTRGCVAEHCIRFKPGNKMRSKEDIRGNNGKNRSFVKQKQIQHKQA